MTAPTADIILGAEVPKLLVILHKNSDASFALEVTNADGSPAILTGLSAAIRTQSGDAWTAAVSGDKFIWTLPAATTDALTYTCSDAVLVVTDTTDHRVVWARGQVKVRA